jgi:hypothetical protein
VLGSEVVVVVAVVSLALVNLLEGLAVDMTTGKAVGSGTTASSGTGVALTAAASPLGRALTIVTERLVCVRTCTVSVSANTSSSTSSSPVAMSSSTADSVVDVVEEDEAEVVGRAVLSVLGVNGSSKRGLKDAARVVEAEVVVGAAAVVVDDAVVVVVAVVVLNGDL